MTSSSDSEHGLQYIGRGALAASEDESNLSSAASSDCRMEGCGGMNPLAGSISEEDADLGQTAELDPDYQ